MPAVQLCQSRAVQLCQQSTSAARTHHPCALPSRPDVEPVPEAKFHNAGMRNYHHPRHYVSGTQHDDAFYSTSALAAQEGPRRGTSPGGRYSDDLQYQQMQQAQQMQETYQQPRRPSMQRPPHLNVRGNPVTPPDSERSSRTSPHSERGRSNQPWPDSARSERSDPDRASRGHFRPALQSGSAPGAVPLETSSQVYGLHAAFGDLEPAAGGDASDRSFREIGVPSASYNDPLRRGVVVPGYAICLSQCTAAVFTLRTHSLSLGALTGRCAAWSLCCTVCDADTRGTSLARSSAMAALPHLCRRATPTPARLGRTRARRGRQCRTWTTRARARPRCPWRRIGRTTTSKQSVA